MSPSQFERLSRMLDKGETRGVIAYVTPVDEADPAVDSLQSHAQNHLPDYMVPVEIVVLPELPRLPNGKVDRNALPSVSARTDRAESAGLIGPIEEGLAKVWESVLGVSLINRNDNFFEIGGDSILSIQAVSRSRLAGIHLEATDLFSFPVLSDLAAEVSSLGRVNEISADAAESETGQLPLTPIQHWFFDAHENDLGHWNQVIYLETEPSLHNESLLEACRMLPSRHDALRQRFRKDDDTWISWIVPDLESDPVRFVDLAEALDAETETLEILAQDSLNFDLSTGPLFRISVIDRGPDSPGLVGITAHHLLIDLVSGGLLADDLSYLYREISENRTPGELTSLRYSVWARHIDRFVGSRESETELSFWKDVEISEYLQHVRISADFGRQGKSVEARSSLSVDQTNDLVSAASRAYNTRTDELLLAALWQSLSASSDAPKITIGLERHGREVVDGLDPSLTIGWMTAFFPLTLPTAASTSDSEAILTMKETFRAIPNGGIGYGLQRYGRGSSQDHLQPPSSTEINFNFLGRTESSGDGSFRQISRLFDFARSENSDRHCLIEVTAWIQENQLVTTFSFDEATVPASFVQDLSDSYVERLGSLIDHCLGVSETRYSPSDFPHAEMSQEDLDEFLDSLD